jgi:hypothetical protein
MHDPGALALCVIRTTGLQQQLVIVECTDGTPLMGACLRFGQFENSICHEIFGFEEGGLTGAEAHEVLHTQFDSFDSNERCQLFCRDKEFHYFCNQLVTRSDRSRLDVDFQSLPVFLKEELIGSLVTITDISSRVKAERSCELLVNS